MMNRRIAVVTCYRDPDYIRAITLRRAVKNIKYTKLITLKNSYHGFLRYPEVMLKLILLRIRQNPDTYLITFRGYEILPLARIICFGKNIIFDEFINPVEWLAFEHKKIRPNGLASQILIKYYRFLLHGIKVIITDTDAHARFSAKLLKIPYDRFVSVPVGTDENIFLPAKKSKTPKGKEFNVFYYGSMLPLHGIDTVLDAAARLSGVKNNIKFTLIGGGKDTRIMVEDAIKRGANITHKEWVPFKELPGYIGDSDLCLGGPFGNTIQSQMVVTGKTYQFLASRKPTLIGRIPDNNLFEHTKNCLLVDQGNAEELAKVILWASENPKKLDEIAHKGRQLFEQKFSIDRISNELEKFI